MRCPHRDAEAGSTIFWSACGGELAVPGGTGSRRVFRFHGTAEAIFPIFIRNLLLSIVTLGVDSF